MMTARVAMCTGLALLALPGIGMTQEFPTPDPVAAPAGRLATALDGLGFELEVNNDKPQTQISFGRRLTPSFSEAPNGGARFSQVSWTAAFSAPFGGKGDLTDSQTLDRLSNGSELKVGLSWFTFSNRDDGGELEQTGAWQVGASATVGFSDFDWRTPVTLAENSTDETPWAIGGSIAYYPADFGSMISAGVEYQRAFEAQDEIILCRPVVVLPADDCVKAPPGAPTASSGFVFNIEYRRTFDVGWSFGDLAISPKISFEEDGGDHALELPIYLVPDGKSPILPGIKLGWSSEDEDVTFGLFLKTSFSFGG